MITYRLDYIVAATFGRCFYAPKQPMDFLPLYEHFARKILDWKLPREVLGDTSGINFSEFDSFSSQEQARRTLAKLFLMAGTDGPHGAFLRRMGIRRWADLAKPIKVKGFASKGCFCYGITHDVRERKLVEPGPNEYHPKAIYGQSAAFRFDGWDRLWRFDLRYGFSQHTEPIHSSWDISIKQGRKESLRTFMDETVPKWLESKLVPEFDPGVRTYRNRCYDELTCAVGEVFGWDAYKDGLTTDALVDDLLDGHKPELTGRRLRTVRNWMRADAKARGGK